MKLCWPLKGIISYKFSLPCHNATLGESILTFDWQKIPSGTKLCVCNNLNIFMNKTVKYLWMACGVSFLACTKFTKCREWLVEAKFSVFDSKYWFLEHMFSVFHQTVRVSTEIIRAYNRRFTVKHNQNKPTIFMTVWLWVDQRIYTPCAAAVGSQLTVGSSRCRVTDKIKFSTLKLFITRP